MPKIVSISTLAAYTTHNKLVLDDGTVVHVLKDGPSYEVGDEYVAPPVEEPAELKPGEIVAGGLGKDGEVVA